MTVKTPSQIVLQGNIIKSLENEPSQHYIQCFKMSFFQNIVNEGECPNSFYEGWITL